MNNSPMLYVGIALACLAHVLAGTTTYDQFADKDGYVNVPGGWRVPVECIYQVGDAVLHESADGTLKVHQHTGQQTQTIRLCPRRVGRPLHGPAWKTYGLANVTGMTSFGSKWKVPVGPEQSSGQILYYWNGIEPTDTSAVLQPVLQWGSTPAGGGDFWAVASWYVSADHGVAISNLIKSSPGDIIDGTMNLDTNGSWVVSGVDVETQGNARLVYKPASTSYTGAYIVLESYSISSCQQYPNAGGAMSFFDITLAANGQPVSQPQWTTHTLPAASCKEHTTVTSPTEVVIHY